MRSFPTFCETILNPQKMMRTHKAKIKTNKTKAKASIWANVTRLRN